MRKGLVIAAVVGAALAATVLAQRTGAPSEPADRSQRRPADSGPGPGPGPDGAPPPGMGPDTKLEWMLVRPGRVRLRETWGVGRVECKPWDAGANAEKAFVRVTAVTVRDAENANDRAAGIELVLEGEEQEHTFLFDAEQIPEMLSALEALDAAAQKLREAGQGTTRRAVWTLNGLEVGMNPRRTGGYLAPMAPDERSTGLSPDDFGQLRRLLQDARDLLGREGAK